MTTSSAGSTALDDFHRTSTGDARREAFRKLVATVWQDGSRTAEAELVGLALVRQLTEEDAEHRDFDGHHAILLGMLLEAGRAEQAGQDEGADQAGQPENTDQADVIAAAAADGLDAALRLLASATDDEPLTLALLYLLAHLPSRRAAILEAAQAGGVAEDDLSRLRRCLTEVDPDDEISVLKLGRSFPSPAAWTVSDEELREIGGWVEWADLGEYLPALWAGETNTLLGYSGAKALWAVEHGEVVDVPEYVIENDVVDVAPAKADNGSAALARHISTLRCVACHSPLAAKKNDLRCTKCSERYSVKGGFVDILRTQDEREDPLMARFHEKWLRPAFMRLIGGNWAGEVTFADENRWVSEFMRAAEGPIVDLGPGAGITTKTLADKHGVERLIAVDASASMLGRLARRVPGAAGVRADATDMPFGDGTVGAVNCWNMLHYFEDKAAALYEIGRVLRPGGSFTLMDLVPDPDHVARYFQGRMGETVVRKLFGPQEIGEWLGAAGMTIQDIYLPGGNFMILRALRTDAPLPEPDRTDAAVPTASAG